MNINVQHLITTTYSEPALTVNFYRVARPAKTPTDPHIHKISKTIQTTCWKIEESVLETIADKQLGIFFDSDAYIVQWRFELLVDNSPVEEVLAYYWKGQRAPKGFSPLPPEIEEQCPVNRVVQWSEPPLFFHSFPHSAIVFSGKEAEFNTQQPHLFLIRGELPQEIHLYEVPTERKHLRSRGLFLLIVPCEKVFIYWYGKQVPEEHRLSVVKNAQPHIRLKQWQELWKDFSLLEVVEGSEGEEFFRSLDLGSDYFHLNLKEQLRHSPKLFYLNSITGTFLATEVEYPLRTQGIVPFPFLQSHLYTATQPALFLLDNHTEVWLWEGVLGAVSEDRSKEYQVELRFAQELAAKYVREKKKLGPGTVVLKNACAYREPLEFKNIFPTWDDC